MSIYGRGACENGDGKGGKWHGLPVEPFVEPLWRGSNSQAYAASTEISCEGSSINQVDISFLGEGSLKRLRVSTGAGGVLRRVHVTTTSMFFFFV